jgi:hypothetical protein
MDKLRTGSKPMLSSRDAGIADDHGGGGERNVESTEWLWENWIPRGYLSMIVGKPGSGSPTSPLDAANAIGGGKYPTALSPRRTA